MLDGPSTRRYNTVFAKNLKLHRGVDNKIQFQLLNQDEKPIDITNKTITFRLLSLKFGVLIRKALTPSLALNGIAILELDRDMLEEVSAQVCNYSLTISDTDTEQPIFLGKDSDSNGTIEVVDGIVPPFIPSVKVTMGNRPFLTPTMQVEFTTSSVSTTNDNFTVQMQYEDFSGTVQFQGSTLVDSDWYNIGDVMNCTNITDARYYNLTGFHPYFRIKFFRTTGDVSNIYLR
jgi:hypothetical protein